MYQKRSLCLTLSETIYYVSVLLLITSSHLIFFDWELRPYKPLGFLWATLASLLYSFRYLFIAKQIYEMNVKKFTETTTEQD